MELRSSIELAHTCEGRGLIYVADCVTQLAVTQSLFVPDCPIKLEGPPPPSRSSISPTPMEAFSIGPYFLPGCHNQSASFVDKEVRSTREFRLCQN